MDTLLTVLMLYAGVVIAFHVWDHWWLNRQIKRADEMIQKARRIDEAAELLVDDAAGTPRERASRAVEILKRHTS